MPLCPDLVRADEIETADTASSEVTVITETYINPLYEDVIDISDLNEPSDSNISTCEVSEYYSSINDAGGYVRSQMKQRSETIEVGIDARLIAGTAGDTPHGWNIAQMEGYYYNLDSTWDAGETTYSYFLRCNDNFDGHTRDDDYTTDEFNSQYPMDEKDYEPSGDEPPAENPFTDVSESDYYYDAVIWAYKNGIVNGKDETHFCPSDPCTRAQSAAFLWRANNEPEPATTENSFEDIDPSDYYYKAVLWAYENGITKGKDETHFQPESQCIRAQVVAFLYRFFN